MISQKCDWYNTLQVVHEERCKKLPSVGIELNSQGKDACILGQGINI